MSAPDEDKEIIAIDPAVREVLKEFDGDPVALAAEIVALRERVAAAAWDRTRLIAPSPFEHRPPYPPDGPPPIRMRSKDLPDG